jgi:hypothetical protein
MVGGLQAPVTRRLLPPTLPVLGVGRLECGTGRPTPDGFGGRPFSGSQSLLGVNGVLTGVHLDQSRALPRRHVALDYVGDREDALVAPIERDAHLVTVIGRLPRSSETASPSSSARPNSADAGEAVDRHH